MQVNGAFHSIEKSRVIRMYNEYVQLKGLTHTHTRVILAWLLAFLPPPVSNVAFSLLAKALARRVAGVDFEEWVSVNNLQRLGLDDTDFDITSDIQALLTKRYVLFNLNILCSFYPLTSLILSVYSWLLLTLDYNCYSTQGALNACASAGCSLLNNQTGR